MAGHLIGNVHGHRVGDMCMQAGLQCLNAITTLMPLGLRTFRSAVTGMWKRTETGMVAGMDVTRLVLVHPEGATGHDFVLS